MSTSIDSRARADVCQPVRRQACTSLGKRWECIKTGPYWQAWGSRELSVQPSCGKRQYLVLQRYGNLLRSALHLSSPFPLQSYFSSCLTSCRHYRVCYGDQLYSQNTPLNEKLPLRNLTLLLFNRVKTHLFRVHHVQSCMLSTLALDVHALLYVVCYILAIFVLYKEWVNLVIVLVIVIVSMKILTAIYCFSFF